MRRAGKTTLARSLGEERSLYEFDPAALKVFREYYPKGNNYLLSPSGTPPYRKRVHDLELHVCDLDGLGP